MTKNDAYDSNNQKNKLLEREDFTNESFYSTKKYKKNGIFSSIFSLIIGFVCLVALYYIFKQYNYKTGLMAYTIYAIISTTIQNGFHFVTMFFAFIIALVETSICYAVYTKSNSFLGFLGRLLLVGFGIIVTFIVLGTAIAMIGGNNSILR